MAEILAPVGSSEALEAALRTGCDAVYLGGEMFSARQNAANFSYDDLRQAVYDCHVRGVKVYQAINTVIFDEQISQCVSAIKFACEIGVDALIIQDLAVYEIARVCAPDMEIHASTQMTLHSLRGVMFASELGFSRAVCSRELPFDIIKELCQCPIDIEAFVHGALCMSVSGQCFMSGMIGSRSANRGLCAQACRLPCSAVRGSDRHDLSLKDMSYISQIREICDAGVASLKIEGRMKRPEYVAASVDSIRKSINGEKYDAELLGQVFSRSGFTDGYYYSKLGEDMFGIRQKDDVLSTSKALPKIHELYRREFKRSVIDFSVKMLAGEPIYVSASDENGVSAEVFGDVPMEAINKPCDLEYLKKQFSKLGDTIYNMGQIDAQIGDGLAFAASALNALRREVCQRLDEARFEYFNKGKKFTDFGFNIKESAENLSPKIRISVSNALQLELVDFDEIDLVIVPLSIARDVYDAGFPLENIAIEMPRFTFDERGDFDLLKELFEDGFEQLVCTNYAHISMGKELGMVMHGGFGLNVTNSLALRVLKRLGVSDCMASFELKAGQINNLGDEMPFGIVGYGHLPLMLTVNCPIKQAVGCAKCTHAVWDRTGRELAVKCSKKNGYVEILNSDLLYTADKLGEFRSAQFIQLDFYHENDGQVAKVISQFKSRANSGLEKITRGLYFRGVL